MATTTAESSMSSTATAASHLHHHHHHHHHHNLINSMPHQAPSTSTAPSASSSCATFTSAASTSSSGSSALSMSSIFERVTNFRRSLIKNQHKKSKIRPASGTFNFFKPATSSGSEQSSSSVAPVIPVSNGSGQHHHTEPVESNGYRLQSSPPSSAPSACSASNRHSIIVDEEDAIYGFTSLHLNNQTSLRRQLKQSTGALDKRTGTSAAVASSSSPSHQLFTSSSCISLYETIDEVEPSGPGRYGPVSSPEKPPPLPPSNPTAKQYQANYSKFRSSSHSSRQLRLSAMQHPDSDWKRNRRSSAIIFGSDFHDLMLGDEDEDGEQSLSSMQPPAGFNQGTRTSFLHNGSAANHHHHQLHHQLNRSSDDLLLMSSRIHHHAAHYHQEMMAADSVRPVINGNTNGRIYENLLNGSNQNSNHNNNNNYHHHPQPQHHHHKRNSDHHNRKLTKDSGYESASTLVSLTQLNGTAHPLQQSSPPTPLPPTPLTMVPGGLGLGHHMISHQLAVPHSRSHSIDSTHSICEEQSPSPPIPNCLDSHSSESPPLPPPPTPSTMEPGASEEEEEDDEEECLSRPPTPPVRYSSLPQNRSFLHRYPSMPNGSSILIDEPQIWHHQAQPTDLSQQMDRLASRQLRGLSASASPPLPPPPADLFAPVDSGRPVGEYHHAKQDSWPSFASSATRSSSSSSPASQRRLRHTAKSMLQLAPTSAGDCQQAQHPAPVTTGPPPPYQTYQAQQPHRQHYPAPAHQHHQSMISQSPSLSSLTSNMAIASSTSVRHSIASCSVPNNQTNGTYQNYQPVPAQQIARSHRVQQVPRQELCTPPKSSRTSMETSLDDLTNSDESVHTSPPPPLPPKSASNSPIHNQAPAKSPAQEITKPRSNSQKSPTESSDIKAIQKRAVYEFYLRQREKKEKESKLNNNSGSPPRTNSTLETDQSIPNGTSSQQQQLANKSNKNLPNSNLQVDEIEAEDDEIVEEELPLPTPPPPLSIALEREPNRFFAEHQSESTSAFPPPPTPLVSESPADFPPPPTPLVTLPTIVTAFFPPPPTPLSSVSDSNTTTARPKQMYHSIDLSSIWPTIDFSRLFQQPLPPPPGVKESNLDSTDDENDNEDEELVSIEANRERQQALDWQLAQLASERRRVELDLERNEQIVGQLVRARLDALDAQAVDRTKLELLTNDMIMITRLVVSIVRQLTRNEQQQRKSQAAVTIKTKECADTNGTSTNDVVNNHDGVHCSEEQPAAEIEQHHHQQQQQQKRHRLLSQLEEAKRLRDNIETRRTMLEQRLTRKCADARNGIPATTTTPSPTTTATTDHSSSPLMTIGEIAPGLVLSDEIDLTTLVHYYLSSKEQLLVQQEVGALLHEDLAARIEITAAAETTTGGQQLN